MRATDAFAWRMEADPLLRSTVVALLLLDRPPDADVVRRRIERFTRDVPVFRARLADARVRLMPPRWELDQDFDLDYHVRRISASGPGGLETLLETARTIGMARFDPARPLWETTLIEGVDGGGSALVLKLHHSLADGIGGLQLADALFDTNADGTRPDDVAPLPHAPSRAKTSVRQALFDEVGTALRATREIGDVAVRSVRAAGRHPLDALPAAARMVRSVGRLVAPAPTTLSPVMTDRRLIWHYGVIEVPFDQLHAAASTIDASLNDAFLAAVTGGLRRYHEMHGAHVEELLLTLPISVRTDADPAGGNRITLVRLRVPVRPADPRERVRAIHERVLAWRREPAIDLTQAVAAVLNVFSTRAVGSMLKHVDFVASDVPGYDEAVSLAGARVTRFYPFGPTIGAAMNVTLMSYAGTCCIGVTTDGGAVPDHEALVRCLQEGIDEVLAAVG